ncbi:MAG: hypothetical protein PHH28_11650 [Desulfuromonadaceae bacterium]|nr:hypothetical protein [Desulfuromonadaceae bacterium]
MKKTVCIVLTAVAMILMSSLPGVAYRGGHRGHVGIGVSIGPVWGPGWWDPYYPSYPYYPYYPYYTAPPVVVPQQQPEIYVEPAPQQQEPVYWYYCRDPEGYYPYIKRCPKGWMRVVPSSPPEDRKE